VDETSLTLLDGLRSRPTAAAWERLVAIYLPLIQGWLRRQGVAGPDVDDLSQEVLAVLVRELTNFRHDGRPGAFRRWLRLITVHRLRDFWRARRSRPRAGGGEFDSRLDQLEDPTSDLSRLWDREHDQHVARGLLAWLEPRFEPSTGAAFRQVVLDGVKPAVAAEELGLSVNAVLLAKSRILRRLREEMRGFTGTFSTRVGEAGGWGAGAA
jgi:RNA polymerase sigma-70 factor (ECF subfamily)